MRGKFVQYYKVREDSLSEENKKIFQEMSLQFDSPDFSDLSDNFYKPDYVNAHLTTAKYIEDVTLTSGTFKIYKWYSYLIFISNENYLAARIEFVNGMDGIRMTSIEVARPFKGLMKAIFLEYLLPRFKRIESDSVQTVNAFLFYKKLALDSIVNKKFDMFVNYNGEEIIITDISQMDKIYGKESDNTDYTYVLKEKKLD